MSTLLGDLLGSLRAQSTSPVPYTARRNTVFGNPFRRDDKAAALGQMGNVGTLFAIVDKNATGVSSVEWHMHRKVQRASLARDRTTARCELCDKPGVLLAERHPALAVWEHPNDFYSTQALGEATAQHLDLVGEGWWVVPKVAGRPIEIWPVRPDRMEPVPDPRQFISGYLYRSPDGEKIPLDLDEVVFIRRPNPWDPFRGMGPVQALMASLDSVRYSAEWNRAFFLNSAQPLGGVEVPDELSDTVFNRLRDQWAENHRGVSRAHRVAIFEQGAKWVNTQFSMRDMQFAELSGVSREQIREAFAMHGHQLGLTEDVNRANAEASDYTYGKGLLVPRLDRFGGALNNDFLRLFGPEMGPRNYEFAYCRTDVVPDNLEAEALERESKATTFATLKGAGVHPEDAAMVAGLPPLRIVKQQPQPAPQSDPNQQGDDGTDGNQNDGQPAGLASLQQMAWQSMQRELANLPVNSHKRDDHNGHDAMAGFGSWTWT
jgi:HK97 family phage portal protein